MCAHVLSLETLWRLKSKSFGSPLGIFFPRSETVQVFARKSRCWWLYFHLCSSQSDALTCCLVTSRFPAPWYSYLRAETYPKSAKMCGNVFVLRICSVVIDRRLPQLVLVLGLPACKSICKIFSVLLFKRICWWQKGSLRFYSRCHKRCGVPQLITKWPPLFVSCSW